MADAADIRFMSRALELADAAAAQGEVPVGALLTINGEIAGEGCNSVIGTGDPTAHAECMALRQAATKLGNYRLPQATLYATIEPCTMCAGALVHARIKRLVFGAREPRAGAVCSQAALLDASFHNHQVIWEEGVLADESAARLQTFFQSRR